MTRLRHLLEGLPLLGRAVVIGALACGAAGALIGLVVGLLAYPPTAPFAVVEIGLPAAIAGAVLGLGTGAVRQAARR